MVKSVGLKQVFFLLFLITLAVLVKAQRFEGGVVVGLSGSQVDGDGYGGYKKAGIYSGLWVRMPIAERLDIQAELAFSQKGSKRLPDKNGNIHYLLKLNYVDFPLSVRYNISDKIGIESGFNAGFFAGAKEYLNYEPIDYGDFHKVELAFLLGLYWNMYDNISIGVRNSNSILSIRKTKPNGSVKRIFDTGQYNNVLTIQVLVKL